MLVAIMILLIFNMLFTIAAVGHLSGIQKILTSLAEAKIAEMKLFNGK